MTDKLIVIPFDYTTEKVLSYVEVQKEIEKETSLIHTNCLDFFSFSTLDKGYDVKVVKKNGEYILLSELLLNDNFYTTRHMRKAHHVHKMLLANSFTFKKGEVAG